MAEKLLFILPEIYYLLMALVLFFLSIRREADRDITYLWAFWMSLAGVLVALASLGQEGDLFFWAYRVDLYSQVFKLLLTVSVFLVMCVCKGLKGVEDRYHPEFYMFLVICTLGMMIMTSGMELMTIYVALELSSFSLYILVPLRQGDNIDIEAGVKYLFIGLTASCIMLFGLSYIFGFAQTTYISELMEKLPALLDQPGVLMALLLLLGGFFFKLAVFPFHFWAPDVYQGAANQVTTYIATASKIAAVALLIRLTALSAGSSVQLMDILMALSIASMTLGNLVAIVQTDIKRLLGYSAIAHAGYVLIGILAMTKLGYSSALFYTTAYVLMNFSAFMVVISLATEGQDLKISELAGLHKRAPLLALTLMMAMFSLAGIPPTVGFTGKFLVFAAAMEQGAFWLVFIGMVNATISLYYYLMVIKAAYLTEPEVEGPAITITMPQRLLNYALIFALVYMGLLPQHFMGLADQAVKSIIPG